ncbi:hypothetical protein ETI01_10915 [Macrococcoides caseolyticum]|uniref:Uncharacterized protein n=1 Tax=Companilactobacillus halodurans TaxID=2584183 RepID=A0A5P0ZSK9_9LACO|nr:MULTISPECIES: hypothetical protein [Bacillota]MCS6105707.1 hypothetical protein [Clostridium botulinum]MCS6112786.1 hypothetical protein [Clostridium botulinum]MCS6133307.1 hypothetical protein [Clostridium botulinum]MCS6168300.1 hypothetical protein [Clostridium botulinum]MDK9864293.1 hypothetical protein [Staphylococcus equorum]
MAKDKLRIIFNIILVVLVLGYGAFVLFTDYGNAKWSLIFIGILIVVGVSRDIIAPKPTSSDENGNN